MLKNSLYTTFYLFCILNKAHTPTEASDAVAVVRVEARIVEVHAVRAAAIVARSRPVAAVETDIADRIPAPVARSRQEDCTGILKSRPLGR